MSNFFRDSSLGFKPRSNIFSKLRVKDTESPNESSNVQEGDSSMEDLFMNSHRDEEPSSITTEVTSDSKFGPQFEAGSSTPVLASKANRLSRCMLDEDDLEITEVREVAIAEESAPSNTNHSVTSNDNNNSEVLSLHLPPQKDCDVDASSHDVLLEAFTNTQKICSNLKQELHRMQSENSKLKSQLQNHQKDKEKIMEKFSEYKGLLNSFGEKSKFLFEQKRQEDLKLKEFKENYDKLLKKVGGYKNDVSDLKSNLSQLKFLKKDTDSELAKRTKESEYLKKELDTCSGQLSEEKLKNSSLVQEFSKIRKEFTENFSNLLSQGQSQVLDKMCLFEQNISKAYHVELNECANSSALQLTKCIQAMHKSLASDFTLALSEANKSISNSCKESQQQLFEQYSQIDIHYNDLRTEMKNDSELQKFHLNTQVELLLAELHKGTGSSEIMAKWLHENQNISQNLTKEVQKGQMDSLNLIETCSRTYQITSEAIKKEIQEGHSESSKSLQNLLQRHQSFFEEIQKERAGSIEWMHKLSQDFSRFRESLASSHDYEAKITELNTQLSSLQLQKSQALSSLGTKEAQYEDMCKILTVKETEISRFQELKKELHKKIEDISAKMNQQKTIFSSLKEENITLKANSENKLIVQNELLKAFQSENDSLKHRATQLEEMRKHSEKENSTRLDKIQKINEQVQKLNVEMVQIKAHELELEEENRNLKKSIEDSRFEFEETTDEFKRLRQRVIVLESDKQDIVSEKMDLQEQVKKMKDVIGNLKKKVLCLQKNEQSHLRINGEEAAETNEIPVQGKEVEFKVSEMQESSRRRIRELPDVIPKPRERPPLPEPASHLREKDDDDEFDLSSSLNDDLELTNPSPIKPVTARRRDTKMKPPIGTRKKLLLVDEADSTPSKHRWKKRRI